ncbi:hypothetical protein AB0P02_01180 [Streptomyces griseoluteus]|uniref:hypothetical protein n=1 Tax=Streptomyces griseoluteus TaxID=29306 RepID=UPI0034382D68
MTFVTIGGVTVGICILVATLVQWWPGPKSLRADPIRHLGALLPFLAAWCYGALAVLGVGGLVGWVADTALWISNWLGDVALVWGVGGQSGQHGAARYLPLTQTGTGIVLVLTVAMLAAIKKSARGRDLKYGMWCGITLGMSAGVAGLVAVPLAQSANWLGAQVYGAL